MKKLCFAFILALCLYSVYGQARDVIPLDDAIHNAALQIQSDLDGGSTVVVYQFQSPSGRLSNYILNELFDYLVNSRQFTVLDRGSQEVVNAELNFQFNESAGMISDDSLSSLTSRIGAQAIVTGSLDDAVDEYRFRIRVIGTETAAATVSYTGRVSKNDGRITAFLGSQKGGGEKIGTGALNVLFGLGSYFEGDITGGLTITAGYALAAGLFFIEATALDWDSPAAGVPATIGVGVAGITLVYGFARPFIYNRAPRVAAVLDNSSLVLTSGASDGSHSLRITYKFTF